MIQLTLDAEALRPLVQQVVAEVLAELDGRGGDDKRLAYSETEAAALLGMRPHQLRDLRLSGKVNAPKLGKSYRYSRALLLRLLEGVRDE